MTELFEPLLQYGVLGVFAIVLIVFARSLLQREQKRADDSAAEVVRLNAMMQDRLIPALVTATQAISASQTILQAIQYQKDIEAAAKAGRQEKAQ